MRRSRRLRQLDAGGRAGISQQTVSRIERGHADRVTLAVLDAVVRALGAHLAVEVRAEGERPLRDGQHAQLEAWVVDTLRRAGWSVEPEVSFNHYGDRGRIDVAALYPPLGLMLVVEVKSRIDDVQELLGRLDIKTRVGPIVARERGWGSPSIVPALVVADGRTARRRMAQHAPLFSRFSVPLRAALAWLRRPSEPLPTGLLLLVSRPSTPAVSARRTQRR